MHKYGRKNLALVHILMQSPYITKIRREIAVTFTTYVGNAGGLLGLCIGFSFMTGIEILYHLFLFFKGLNKKAWSKQKQIIGIHVENHVHQNELLSSKTQTSIKMVEDELHQIAMYPK